MCCQISSISFTSATSDDEHMMMDKRALKVKKGMRSELPSLSIPWCTKCNNPSINGSPVYWLGPSQTAQNWQVLFRDNRRGKLKTLPPPLPDITRESSFKILGLAFSNNLSATDHICCIVSETVQTPYAVRVLTHTGLSNVELQEVFRAVVVSRLTCASMAWSRFVAAINIHESTVSFTAASAVDSAHRTYQTLARSWRRTMTDFSVASAATHSMSYIAFCCLSEPWSVILLAWQTVKGSQWSFYGRRIYHTHFVQRHLLTHASIAYLQQLS